MRYQEYMVVFFLGLLFAFGLGISGMMSPFNIQAFLDVAGNWKGDLLVVLLTAVATTFLLYPLVFKRKMPVFREHFSLPARKDIDGKLVLGSIMFGIGWALTGLCPGPAIANSVGLSWWVIVYILILLVVFALYERA